MQRSSHCGHVPNHTHYSIVHINATLRPVWATKHRITESIEITKVCLFPSHSEQWDELTWDILFVFLIRSSPWSWNTCWVCAAARPCWLSLTPRSSADVRHWPSFPVGDDYYYSRLWFCFPSLHVSVSVVADQSSAPCRPGDGGRLNLDLVGKINLRRLDYFCNGMIKGEGVILACREQWRVF